MGRVIGIKFGNTYSMVSAIIGGEPQIIANRDSDTFIPSIVGFNTDGSPVVGMDATHLSSVRPERVFSSLRPKIGTDFRFVIDNRFYTIEELVALVLQKLKQSAEELMSDRVTDVVVSVPPHFIDIQRGSMKTACEIAGLNVLRIINDSTAAALAYRLDQSPIDIKILVWNLGGSSFNVTILNTCEGCFEILSTAGDTTLGINDWMFTQSVSYSDLIRQMEVGFDQAIADSGCIVSDLDKVILTGGGMRTSPIRNLAKRMTNKDPLTSIDPHDVIAIGNAVQVGQLTGAIP